MAVPKAWLVHTRLIELQLLSDTSCVSCLQWMRLLQWQAAVLHEEQW
jgi:hypothetical protein